MSDQLSAQLSAFKNKLKSGPTVTARRIVTPQITRPTPTPSVSSSSETKRSMGSEMDQESAKRAKISGSQLSTQLHLAVEYLKSNDSAITLDQLRSYVKVDMMQLLPLLQGIDRIKYYPETRTLEYVSLHNIKSADDLLQFLMGQPTYKGTSVKELRDGWSGCIEAINELEAENKILVSRTKKENSPRLVWANLGGQLGLIEDEFIDMWNRVKMPGTDDLYQALVDQGLKPTSADPNILKKKMNQPEKKQKKPRRGKVTNTHMKGILIDYSQLN